MTSRDNAFDKKLREAEEKSPADLSRFQDHWNDLQQQVVKIQRAKIKRIGKLHRLVPGVLIIITTLLLLFIGIYSINNDDKSVSNVINNDSGSQDKNFNMQDSPALYNRVNQDGKAKFTIKKDTFETNRKGGSNSLIKPKPGRKQYQNNKRLIIGDTTSDIKAIPVKRRKMKSQNSMGPKKDSTLKSN